MNSYKYKIWKPEDAAQFVIEWTSDKNMSIDDALRTNSIGIMKEFATLCVKFAVADYIRFERWDI